MAHNTTFDEKFDKLWYEEKMGEKFGNSISDYANVKEFVRRMFDEVRFDSEDELSQQGCAEEYVDKDGNIYRQGNLFREV